MPPKKKQASGFVGTAIGLLTTLAMIGLVLAAFKEEEVNSLSDALNYAQEKSLHYADCIPKNECGLMAVVDNFELPDGTTINLDLSAGKSGEGFNFSNFQSDKIDNSTRDENTPYVNLAGSVTEDATMKMLTELTYIPVEEYKKIDINYNRQEWRHWSTFGDRGCWNTRDEVLSRDALPGTIRYLGRDRLETDYSNACTVGISTKVDGNLEVQTEGSGVWIDPFSGDRITNPRNIDVDHIVPLSYAAKMGGQSWSVSKKEKFANDLDNLLATSARENRRKGDKGPGEYMPPLESYHCEYAKTFSGVIYKYNLKMTEADKAAVLKGLESCN